MLLVLSGLSVFLASLSELCYWDDWGFPFPCHCFGAAAAFSCNSFGLSMGSDPLASLQVPWSAVFLAPSIFPCLSSLFQSCFPTPSYHSLSSVHPVFQAILLFSKPTSSLYHSLSSHLFVLQLFSQLVSPLSHPTSMLILSTVLPITNSLLLPKYLQRQPWQVASTNRSRERSQS